MALNFPASSASPFLGPNGVIYTWNTDGYWEAAPTGGDYLKLDASNGPVTGPLTFEGATTHEAGVQLPNLTSVTALATDVNGNIIAGTGGGGVIGDGQINVNAGNGCSVSGTNATANQSGNTTRTITVAGGDGLTQESNGLKVDTTVVRTNQNATQANTYTFSRASSAENTYDTAAIITTNNTSGRWAIAMAGQAGFWGKSIFWKLSTNVDDDISRASGGSSFGWSRSGQHAAMCYDLSNQTGGMIKMHRNNNNGATIAGYRAKTDSPNGYIELRQDGLKFTNTTRVAGFLAPAVTAMSTNVVEKFKQLQVQDHLFAQSEEDAEFTAHHFDMTLLKTHFPTLFRTGGGHAIGDLVDTSTGETIESGCEKPKQVILDDGHTWTQTGTADVSDYYCREDLIPFFVKAIQELNSRIEELESNTLQPLYSTLADLPDASEHHGKTAHVHSEGALYFAHAGSWVKLQNA